MGVRRRDEPMPVKHWSFAGLILTYWCNAACASCYLCCGPRRSQEMTVGDALGYWRSLASACPRGCRIHLTGGEPFGDWPRLLEICRRARQEGLRSLEKVETNAFWATDPAIVRDRLRALDEAGLWKLAISCDPYHQQFVPIERCRLAAAVAEEVLGGSRVQVRWRDWLAEGQDTAGLDPADRDALFLRYAAGRRDRWTGRAAGWLAGALAARLSSSPPAAFADKPCHEALLRGRHVHLDGAGWLIPGTCAGIVLGSARGRQVVEVWRELAEGPSPRRRPLLAALADGGPAALLPSAESAGYRPRPAYAGKCHLCWDIRQWLARRGHYPQELQPAWMYDEDRPPGGGAG